MVNAFPDERVSVEVRQVGTGTNTSVSRVICEERLHSTGSLACSVGSPGIRAAGTGANTVAGGGVCVEVRGGGTGPNAHLVVAGSELRNGRVAGVNADEYVSVCPESERTLLNACLSGGVRVVDLSGAVVWITV